MTTSTREQQAQPTRNGSRSVLTLLRDGGYATIGATDSAVTYVRRLGEKANEVRSEVADLSKLRSPSALSASLRELSDTVEQRFDSLADRGREVVASLQRNRSAQETVDRSRLAGRQAREAATSARSAAEAGSEVVEQVVEPGSEAVEQVVKPVDDAAPHFESMSLEDLRSLARTRGIEGRSEMNKAQLIEALRLP